MLTIPRKPAIILLAILGGTWGIVEIAYAQAELPMFSPEQVITIVLIGVGAGFLRAYQGYRTTTEDFDKLKFFDGVIYSVIASIPIAVAEAINVANGGSIGFIDYVIIFFAAIGAASQIQSTRQKTVPSNT